MNFLKKNTNTKTEKENRKYDVLILYLLPMCGMNCLLHSKSENRCVQQKLAYVGMFIMLFYRSWLKIDGLNIFKGKELKKERFNSLFTINLCEDVSTHFLSIIYALQNISNEFRMNRIGTILNEHLFSFLRFRSGKEQTLKSFKASFSKIALSLKNRSLKKDLIEERNYDTATVNEGIFILSEENILNCEALAARVLIRAGIVFTRESEFYDLLSPLVDNYQSFKEYTEWDKEFFSIFSHTSFHKERKISKNQYWYVHSSNFRLNNGVIGRNIRSRYQASITKEN